MWGADTSGSVFSTILGTQPLTTNQLTMCWVLAILSLVVYPVSKMIPIKHFVTDKIDLEADPETSIAHKALFKVRSKV
jgi:hypothetical protein